jgi:Uma2 family endonuclease
MVGKGVFRPDDRLELLDGLLVVKEPQDTPHATAVALVGEALRVAFGAGFHVRHGAPVALGRWSEPEPDLCVVPGSPRDYLTGHPTSPVLVVEVSSYSRLRFDRTRKAALYARARIPEYWIVDLVGRALEIHREPSAAPRARGWRYQTVEHLGPDAVATPLALPTARVRVADLLP